MLKFCLMTSHACPPGPGFVFLQDRNRVVKRSEKIKLKSSPKRKNRRGVREKDVNRRSCLHACICLLSLIVDKPSGKTAVLSIKNS
ncbi:hypothetical protein K2173_003038 [Erythroxylum novogranatense]|uniref:Uncharacterized protein n=1 Tax=Erythroxylum novogranatense TaxID=1862640 RepID=A0AAV8S880_9ROSI|nr:hypothetical protein K2173_003038 [Erythroxylum novogranatense]